MASDPKFVSFVLDQLQELQQISAKKMFGEYGLFMDKKIFGLICDNKLSIKPTLAGRKFIANLKESPPYPGAKPSFLIDDRIEDRKWLCQLVQLTCAELPKPKEKKQKKNLNSK